MCIFAVSSAHKKFPLILIDNRDEVLERPTAAAHWWEGTNIYAPQDLGAQTRGTWIGVTRTGRFAVLVNAYEDENKVAKLSRGIMPKLYLESNLSPHAWITWLQKTHQEFLRESGGFTLLVGATSPLPEGTYKVHYEFVSNYESDLPQQDQTVALSNGSYKDDSWTKVSDVMTLFPSLLTTDNQEDLVHSGLNILSYSQQTPPESKTELRKHVFVPACELGDGARYGTRTQTVILIEENGSLTFTQRDVTTGKTDIEKFNIIPT